MFFSQNFSRISRNKFLVRLAAGIMTGCLLLTRNLTVLADQTPEERLEVQRSMAIQSNEIPNWPAGPVVNAESAILMDADTGAILYAKNIYNREFPASTTKILTCLIATEQCSMDEIVTFSTSAVYDTPRNSSHIAMDVGEQLTMEQAISGILIASANEVAFAVGEHISGTWQDFAELMNQRAKELGCLDSHFVNPNGLPDDNHYTTAYDLATIGRAFFANEMLCRISSSPKLQLPHSDGRDDIVEYSKNQLLAGKKYEYEYLVGSKTGYTDTARNCLVSCAQKDGMKLICVVFKDESPLQFEDTVTLFDYGFSNFDKVNVSQAETKYNIDNAGFFYSDNDILGSSKPILSLNTEDSIIVPKTVTFDDLTSSISYDTADETQAAVITYTYNDVFLGTASVDFAVDKSESYAFDTPDSVSAEEESVPSPEPESQGPPVIFINVGKILLWAAGIIAVLLLAAGAVFFLKNYQPPQKNNRRTWLKERRRRKNHYQTVQESFVSSRRTQIKQARRRRRRAKRPNRFRDYDF